MAKRFPRDFQYPLTWTAQLYQESLCDPAAKSPAGAGGIAQFMTATAGDISRRFGYDFDRFDARQSIDKGAYYQAKRSAPFRRRHRTPEQAHEWGLCSYNAGIGNCLKAQRFCENARLWADAAPCLVQVTGDHSIETRQYVRRIKSFTNEMGDAVPWEVPEGWRKEFTLAQRVSLASRVDVRRYFTGSSWCTYFAFRGGYVSASHCHAEVSKSEFSPPFLDGLPVRAAAGQIDAVFYGVDMSGRPPRDIIDGEPIETIGYPAGSDALTYRKGRAYVKRSNGGDDYDRGGWIVVFDAGLRPTFEREPVVGGQSGSPGFNAAGEIVCIVVNQNGQTDLNGDKRPDNSMDCVSLHDVWEVFQ